MTAKNFYVSLFAVGAIGSISTLLSPLPANAINVTFTDEISFLSNTSSTYLEDFSSLSTGPLPSPQTFSQSGFSYSVSVTNPNQLFVAAGSSTGSRFIGANSQNDPLTINFTSGNVTAVGGKFFLTDISSSLISGVVTLTLNDSTTLSLTSPTSVPTPFGGFISTDGAVITSLTFTGANGSYTSIDDLYVGTSTAVPFEFSPDLGIGLLGGAWLVRRSLKKRLEKKSEQAEIKG